jgi:ADP-ribosylglycohydrolase
VPVDGEGRRARGALWGLAVGDALGMPTEGRTRDAIAAEFGTIHTFRDAPDDHAIGDGRAAGTVTDDTELAVLVGDLVLAGDGTVQASAMADRLQRWDAVRAARGTGDLLGPSTRRALDLLAAGEDPARTGRFGTTNGAAMRVAPVGVAWPSRPLGPLVDAVIAADRLTHDTGVAHTGAVAVAAAVSAGIDGADARAALRYGVAAARDAVHCGHEPHGDVVLQRLDAALAATPGTLHDVLAETGTGLPTQESVPAAFAIAAAHPADLWTACCTAAAVGGDTDTIAAMTGAMLGAALGSDAVPAAAVQRLRDVNALDLDALADRLVALRQRLRATPSRARR